MENSTRRLSHRTMISCGEWVSIPSRMNRWKQSSGKLEQYYEVKIINKNEEIASRSCTGKFRQKEGIEHVMKVLQKYVKFNYIQDDEKKSDNYLLN